MIEQKQIEEMAKVIEEAMTKARRTLGGHNNIAMFYAEILSNAGWIKHTENAVLLTKEEYEMLANQYKNLEIKYSNLCDNYRLCKDANETLKQNVIIARQETAERFAERLKKRFNKSREYYEIDTGTAWSDGQIGSRINDTIDEICKEITEGKCKKQDD